MERTSKIDGKSLYARIYWFVAQQRYGGSETFRSSSLSWETMIAGMDDILAKYPDDWNTNNFLNFSCIAGDRKQARKLLNIMGGNALKQVWRDMEHFEICKDFAMDEG